MHAEILETPINNYMPSYQIDVELTLPHTNNIVAYGVHQYMY